MSWNAKFKLAVIMVIAVIFTLLFEAAYGTYLFLNAIFNKIMGS